jgi:hypothetical protein
VMRGIYALARRDNVTPFEVYAADSSLTSRTCAATCSLTPCNGPAFLAEGVPPSPVPSRRYSHPPTKKARENTAVWSPIPRVWGMASTSLSGGRSL